MTKVGWTNAVYTSSNIQHSADHYVYSVKPGIGDTDTFNNEGLGWDEDVWNLAEPGVGGWTTNEAVWIGGDLSEPSNYPSEPDAPNVSTCTGWKVTDKRCLLEWIFKYCTVKY